ncbi:proline-rich protein 36-like [Macrobrachium nipponense]|uniref:proline-rich protein 36-like n=1 Tax=Macrobrachium nipponense TaxID=159736 RepID=UPI0030C84CFD
MGQAYPGPPLVAGPSTPCFGQGQAASPWPPADQAPPPASSWDGRTRPASPVHRRSSPSPASQGQASPSWSPPLIKPLPHAFSWLKWVACSWTLAVRTPAPCFGWDEQPLLAHRRSSSSPCFSSGAWAQALSWPPPVKGTLSPCLSWDGQPSPSQPPVQALHPASAGNWQPSPGLLRSSHPSSCFTFSPMGHLPVGPSPCFSEDEQPPFSWPPPVKPLPPAFGRDRQALLVALRWIKPSPMLSAGTGRSSLAHPASSRLFPPASCWEWAASPGHRWFEPFPMLRQGTGSLDLDLPALIQRGLAASPGLLSIKPFLLLSPLSRPTASSGALSPCFSEDEQPLLATAGQALPPLLRQGQGSPSWPPLIKPLPPPASAGDWAALS